MGRTDDHPGQGRMSGADGGGRLFLAVGLTEAVRRELDAYLGDVGGERGLPGRTVRPENWHLTLRFLGDTEDDVAARLRAELRRAALGTSFPMRFGALGAFPTARRASVLWVGVDEGAGELARLASATEAAAVRAGFAAEPRRFRAHLTLSRIRPPTDVSALVGAAPPAGVTMEVDAVALYRSHLGGGPPRYEVVERFPLTAGDG